MQTRRRISAGLAGLGLAIAMLGPAASATAETVYSFDRQHTALIFAWQRIGLSRQQGRFTDVSGTLEFDPARPEASRLDVAIRASSLQTGVDVLDRHLRSADFFDVAAHPIITFRSSEVRITGEKSGEVTGELTMLGVAKPVTLQVEWVFTGAHPLGQINPTLAGRPVAVFSARTTLQRSAWGLGRGIPLVSDEIEIRIDTEALGK
jgi:polyisoprenoid-binding protein YceI